MSKAKAPRSAGQSRPAVLAQKLPSHVDAIQPGKQAIRGNQRHQVQEAAPAQVTDSLNLEARVRPGHSEDRRWDYLLGVSGGAAAGDYVTTVEIHPVTPRGATELIEKKEAALAVLPKGLVRCWHWVASGATRLPQGGPERRWLNKSGIILSGSCLRVVCCPT